MLAKQSTGTNGRIVGIGGEVVLNATLLKRFNFDAPFYFDEVWYDSKTGSAIRPFDDVWSFGNCCTKPTWMRHDADSSEIEPIRILACLNCHIGVSSLVSVPFTSSVEKSKRVIVKAENSVTQVRSKFRRTGAMIWIGYFVNST